MGIRRRAVKLLLSCVMGVAACIVVAGPAQASITDPPGVIHLESQGTRTCIDATNAPSGTQLIMWRCLNTSYEQWRRVRVPVPGDQYERCDCSAATMIVNVATEMCVAAENSWDNRVDVGIIVRQETCNPADQKQWWLFASNYKIRMFTILDKGLDVYLGRSDNGTPLQAYTLKGRSNQQWWFSDPCCDGLGNG